MPIDRKLINKSEKQMYEFNNWLHNNGYRETKDNRVTLRKNVPNNSKWTDLDHLLKGNPTLRSQLEKKSN